MLVAVRPDSAGPKVGVEDPDDCTRLHVVAPGVPEPAVGDALLAIGLGRAADAGHVWLDIAALRARAGGGAVGDDWATRFDAMVEYARGKGWVDEAGSALAAHIEEDR